MKNDIWLIINTCEECGLHHRKDAEEISHIVIRTLGTLYLAPYFGIDKSEVLPRLKQYVFNHEF